MRSAVSVGRKEQKRASRIPFLGQVRVGTAEGAPGGPGPLSEGWHEEAA